MKIKNSLAILASAIILLAGICIVQSAVPEFSSISVSLVSQEPDPGQPGEVIDVRFKIDNNGGSGTDDVYLEFVEEYPFTLYSGDKERNLGSLQSLQTGSEGVIELFKLKIDQAAVEETYYVDVRYKIGKSGVWTTIKDFPIRVRTRDIVLSVDSIETKPALISPGDNFELSMTLMNNADSLVKDVTVKLDVSSTTTPFAPSNSIAEKQLYQIESKIGKILKFDLVALPSADGGIYKIPVTISYTDQTGTSYSKEDYISLKVASAPDLLTTIDSSEINSKVRSGKVVIKIVNRGLTNIKLLTAKLGETKDFELISVPEVYVGNIDSDDYETVEYSLNLKSYEKSIALPLVLSYMDATNNKHTEKLTLDLKTYSKSILATILLGLLNVVIIIAVVAGIVFGIRWLYKRRKHKRQG
jgi:hypothetical protein